ncbi:MAG: peptidylprolyl isomerase [Thermodesulfobacteriota bacterium]
MKIKMTIRVTLLLVLLTLLTVFSPHDSSAGGNPIVIMETSKGSIKIELFEKEAPITVKNFLAYVSDGFYNGLIFHRVIPGFMIQGGGFDVEMNRKRTKSPIKNEARSELPNRRGTIAMARTNVIDSATSQFFINLVDNGFLNHRDNTMRGFGYAVFGKVVEGMNVVDEIGRVRTDYKGGMKDVPVEPVIIKGVRIAHPVTPPTPPSIH